MTQNMTLIRFPIYLAQWSSECINLYIEIVFVCHLSFSDVGLFLWMHVYVCMHACVLACAHACRHAYVWEAVSLQQVLASRFS